jgi:tetratricopeptide (TPR) repeat protein
MNILTNESIIKANERTYISLLVSLEAGIGMLQIFIAVCDADRQRENIIANYEHELASTYRTYRVYLDPQEPSLKKAINEQVIVKENAIATVLGAEKLGLFNQDESLTKFFGYLQWTREALRELKMPIILWIPSRIHDQLAKKAPDFWSWRNGIFMFRLEPSLFINNLSNNSMVIGDIDVIDNNESSSVFSPEQLEASLAEAINQWGENSGKLATLYSQLGNLYAERIKSGKAADREQELTLAEQYFNQAIVLQTEFQQQDAVANSLNNLAALYSSQGRYNDAEPLFLQSLDIYKRQLGNDHPHVATSLNNLAELYKSQGRYNDAEPLFLQSLDIRKRQLGNDHPDVASSLNNLAALYFSQGRYNDAEPLYLQSLDIRKRQLGNDHPDVAGSLNNLAALYFSQGRYNDAEPLYLQSLDICKRQLGNDHPHIATSLNNLALLYESQENYLEAENLAQQALVIYQQKLGNEHPSTQNAALMVKFLYIMKLLSCNKDTLFGILQALAEQANLPDLNTETMLALLEQIENNPQLLSSLREYL